MRDRSFYIGGSISILRIERGRYLGDSFCKPECKGVCDQPKEHEWHIFTRSLLIKEHVDKFGFHVINAWCADVDGMVGESIHEGMYEYVNISVRPEES